MLEINLLERVRLLSHQLESAEQLFQNCYALQAVEIDTSAITSFRRCFLSCTSLRRLPPLDTSNGRDFSEMFSYCSAPTELPPLDTSRGEIFSRMFSWINDDGSRLTVLPPLDTSNGREFEWMFSGTALPVLPRLDLSGLQGQVSFSASFALRRIEAVGIGATNQGPISVDLSWTALDGEALNDLYRSLETITCSGTIEIDGTPGSQQPEHQPQLATSKGWTVAY